MGCHSKGMSIQWGVTAKRCQSNGMSKQRDVTAKGCQSNGMSKQRDVKDMGCHSNGMSNDVKAMALTFSFWRSSRTKVSFLTSPPGLPKARDLTKSCLSHSFRFPRLWTQHQEVMPKSCLLVFPHSERKRQNNPFQIITFHFHPFFSSLRLRFTVSYLPTFFPKQVYLYGVLSKNSVNRYWVAMAPLHRKRPSLGALGRLVIHGYTMLYTCLPLVSHLSPLVSHLSPTHLHFAWCAWCASTAPSSRHRFQQQGTEPYRT